MDVLPTGLVVCSTFMHTAWNALAKQSGGIHARIWRMQLCIVGIGVVPFIASLLLLPCLSVEAILCLLGSGLSCAFYFLCLARGYGSGDFTTVYPLVRALPVMLVGLGDALRGRPPDGFGWIGISLVGSGCLLVPLASLRHFDLRQYLKPVVLWSVLAAGGTVGYSLLDKIGTEAIPPGPLESAVYCYVFFLVATAWYWPLRRTMVRTDMQQEAGWRIPAMTGVLCFLTYWLVLWAYQLSERASYIVAFRQFSIVIGYVYAFVALNEPGKAVRFVGSLVITCGLILLKAVGD